MSRLAQGGLVDRAAPLAFSFDGRRYTGLAGDTLASALVANGVKLVGRSFKYHRPRGIHTAGSDEPNALVELRTGARREPNTRATTVELYDGLEAASQNRWPSLGFDALAVNGLLAPVFGAGFYYKTFMWPAALWERLYEPAIRRAAGLGRAAAAPDPDHYEKAFAFCDVLVIGGGPAGLMAALAAGRAGARVILADEDFRLGGRLLAERHVLDDFTGADWAARAAAELASLPNVRLMPRTTVFGVYDGGTYGALERVADHLPVPPPHQPRQRSWRIVARRAVLAAGAGERPVVFGGNDRPGVMLAGAARAYAVRFGAAVGERIAVFTGNDSGWRAAFDMADAGAGVTTVIDARAEVAPGLAEAAKRRGIDIDVGGALISVYGRILNTVHTSRGLIPADALAVSGGWSPNVQLTCHLGGKPVWNEELEAFLPGSLPPGLKVAGAANGAFGTAACLASGAAAGLEAATATGFPGIPIEVPQVERETLAGRAVFYAAASRGMAFVDLQNDVTAKDIGIAHAEGFRPAELLKRYTTLGMATDQGKTSNVNGLAIMAALTGRPIAETGTTVFRPPYTPVAMGALAGHHRGKDFRPIRVTPSHGWAQAQGAVFVEAGPWLRAQYFPRAGETDWLETVNREVIAVRSGAGFCDVSTLGKIEIFGRDAGQFLDRVYINGFSKLAVGKARYGVMLREDGMVMDDGTTSRLADDRYFMTTTTANAAKVFQHLEFCRQVLWPGLDVVLVSATEQWAQVSLAGPRAREVLGRVVDDGVDVSNTALPFMGVAEVTALGGVRARLYRISFSGELAYEIGVPTRFGERLAQALFAAGALPYGTEALGVMRIEKGHPAGNELNGHTTAGDLGLGRLMSTSKDFIGRIMAARPGLTDPERPALVGFRPVDRGARLRAGAHFVGIGRPNEAAHDEGYMTSVAFSPSLGHWIGLGLLKRGPQRLGERVRAYDPVRGGDTEVEVVSPVFVDPQGERVRG